MNIINFSEFLNWKFKKETAKFFKEIKGIETRPRFYQCRYGAGIPDLTSFTGFVDSFAVFETSNCNEILIEKKDLERFVTSQERLKQNVKPLHEAIQAMNNLK
jgi:hypothetical protein